MYGHYPLTARRDPWTCSCGRQEPPVTRRVTGRPAASERDGGGVRAAHRGTDAGREPAEPAADRPGGAGRERSRRGGRRSGRHRPVGGGRAHRVTSSAGRVGGFTRRRPDGSPSAALQEPATAPVVDRELVGREQAHAERVARRRAPGSHTTSAPSVVAAGKRPGREPGPAPLSENDDDHFLLSVTDPQLAVTTVTYCQPLVQQLRPSGRVDYVTAISVRR